MSNIVYIFKRMLMLIPTLLGIVFLCFILLKSIPGDPVYSLVGERADKAVIEAYRTKMGLDKPLPVQFVRYISMIASGNLGVSYYTKVPVVDMLVAKFPNTFRLAFLAMLFASVLGILAGILAAVKRDTFIDRFIITTSVLLISVPVFWFGLILVIIFSGVLGILPPAGTGYGISVYIILPAMTLGSRSAAYITRITRTSMIEVFSSQYVLTAKAKGLSPFKVIFKHVFRNALIPVITLIGIDFGSYLNGSVLTETIFGWDGIGRYAMSGILKRDYPVIFGTVLFGAALFVLVNMLVDISYKIFNPKVKYD